MPKSKEERVRRRSIKKLSSIDDEFRQDLRKAVELEAKRAFQLAINENPSYSLNFDDVGSRSGGKNPSMDHSIGSHSSLMSRERAIGRGSRRGLFERNEIENRWVSHSDESEDYEATAGTTLESRTTGKSTRKAKFQFLKLKRKSKSNQSKRGSLTSEISKEAFMCGVCAKSFSSFDAAAKHEDFHVREVVDDLGWVRNNSNFADVVTNLGWTKPDTSSNFHVAPSIEEEPGTPSRDTKQLSKSLSQPEFSTPSQPRPDVLRMSTPAIHSRVSFQPEYTPALQRKRRPQPRMLSDDILSVGDDDTPEEYGLTTSILGNNHLKMSPIVENQDFLSEHEVLVPREMRDYIVLADEALADVCDKARPLILTPSEVEAELELEWLAKDKAHYDLLARREEERQQEGKYTQLRAEGKTILSKVQNKFVDAYQLMKEGKSKRRNVALDHYTRKLKGDADSSHVIDHNQMTLYVNVIVKNSLKVVSYELERLAKERWDKSEHEKDDKDDLQTQRFQKFREVAQVNLVKLAGLALASDFTPRRIAVQLSNDFYR